MSYWVKVTLNQAEFGIPLVTEYDYRTETVPTTAHMVAVVGEFVTNIIPKINAIQVDQVANINVRAVWRGNTAVQAEANVSGTGDVASAEADVQVSSASIALKKFVAETNDFNDIPWEDELRNITHGYVFIPGADDDWIFGGRSIVPGALASALETLLDELATSFSAAGSLMIPIVHGYALPLVGEPNPKPFRPESYADIEAVSFKWVTWHESRQRNTVR